MRWAIHGKMDGMPVQVSENAYDKDLGYITNKGKAIHSDVEVVDGEGGLGAIQLSVYDEPQSLH